MPASWFTEKYTAHDLRSHRIKKILVRKKTRYQKAVLAETYSFGRCLILDGEIQSAESDEFIYHEALIQPAMVMHPRPREVLILGGGEGASVREVLRHPSVYRVTMVDLDGEVVLFCKKYLMKWHQGSFDHPKARLIVDDARTYIKETPEMFDVIVGDLPTPSSAQGPVADLYTLAFYKKVLRRLNPGGIFVTQAGSGSGLSIKFHQELMRTLQKLFKIVRPYYAFVPSFDEPWSFLMASRDGDPLRLSANAIDKKLGTISESLRFYDGLTHEGLFRVPKYMRTR